MRRWAALVLGIAVLPVGAAHAGARGANDVAGFSTPSKNIGCQYARFAAQPNAPALPATLRCDIRSGLRPRPAKPHGCDLDWGDSLEMRTRSRVSVTCHGDTALGDRHILGYGKTWRHGGFTCVSRTTGLTCRNLAGHGFFMSRQRSRIF
jgi:Family of unknown function (DUF6636)